MARTKPISAASANAIRIVIKSVHFLLDAMLSMTDDDLKPLRVINYVRMAYSVVLLIKMSATTTAPNSTKVNDDHNRCDEGQQRTAARMD